ncbi:MAG: membrane protein insertase YidC [Bacteroidales bacterium]|nr:membrane protein insertase YidC [Bacteroidales bacterium]
MNKQSIIGLILIFAIFMGYMWWMSPSKEELSKMRATQDSIAQAYKDSVAIADSISLVRDSLMAAAQAGDSSALASLNPEKKMPDMGAFNASASGNRYMLKIDNGKMALEISTEGASVQRVTLAEKDYLSFDSLPLTLVTPSEDNMNLVFGTQDNRVVNTKNLVFVPFVDGNKLTGAKEWKIEDSTVLSLRAYAQPLSNDSTMQDAASEDQYLEFRYILKPNSYEVGFDIAFHNLDNVVQRVPYMDFQWNNRLLRQEKVDPGMKNARNRQKDPERMYTNLYYKPVSDKPDALSMSRDDDKQVKTSLEWIAYKQQFFTSILMAQDSMQFQNADVKTFTDKEDTADNYLVSMSSTIGIPYENGNGTMALQLYYGPSKYHELRGMHRGFERMIPLGWGFFLTQWFCRFVILPAFDFLSGFITNYGIIIILLTLFIKIVLFPLTFKSYQTTAIMRILKPEIDALNKKYPNQDQMMQKQQAMSRLQKSAGISPLAGCLPMLVQLPILWGMYRFFPTSIELRQQPFLWCDDLSTYDSILDFGFDIPLYGNHISLFCLLMFGMQMLYTFYTMKGQNQTQGMPGMKFMMYLMPFMMLFIFNSQSAALNIYYLLNLVITMAEMILIRQFTSEKKVRARMVAYENNAKGKTPKKSKFQKRLEEMQRMSEQMQKQQGRR